MSVNKHNKRKSLDPQNQPFTVQPKPHSVKLEQLRQIIENRLKDEQDRRLIKFLLSKETDEKHFIDELLLKMLYIKKHFLKSQPKDKKQIEQVIYEILYNDSITKGQLNEELLGEEQLIQELIKDKRLIEKIFEEKFVYILRNPKLEGEMASLIGSTSGGIYFLTMFFDKLRSEIEFVIAYQIGYIERNKIETVSYALNTLQYEILQVDTDIHLH